MMLARAALTMAFLVASTTAALADLAPEAYEPQSPTFWIAILAVAAAIAGYLLYRRRSK